MSVPGGPGDGHECRGKKLTCTDERDGKYGQHLDDGLSQSKLSLWVDPAMGSPQVCLDARR